MVLLGSKYESDNRFWKPRNHIYLPKILNINVSATLVSPVQLLLKKSIRVRSCPGDK